MTENNEQRLAELRRPLGVYDLRPWTINRGELAAYGRALGRVERGQAHPTRGISLSTAGALRMERFFTVLH